MMKITCIYKDYPVEIVNKDDNHYVVTSLDLDIFKENNVEFLSSNSLERLISNIKYYADKLEENKKNRRNEAICVPWKFLINNKTFVVDCNKERDGYYCNVTPLLTLTGKSVQEIVTQLGELAEAFN